jgi:hypothetical protein
MVLSPMLKKLFDRSHPPLPSSRCMKLVPLLQISPSTRQQCSSLAKLNPHLGSSPAGQNALTALPVSTISARLPVPYLYNRFLFPLSQSFSDICCVLLDYYVALAWDNMWSEFCLRVWFLQVYGKLCTLNNRGHPSGARTWYQQSNSKFSSDELIKEHLPSCRNWFPKYVQNSNLKMAENMHDNCTGSYTTMFEIIIWMLQKMINPVQCASPRSDLWFSIVVPASRSTQYLCATWCSLLFIVVPSSRSTRYRW